MLNKTKFISETCDSKRCFKEETNVKILLQLHKEGTKVNHYFSKRLSSETWFTKTISRYVSVLIFVLLSMLKLQKTST